MKFLNFLRKKIKHLDHNVALIGVIFICLIIVFLILIKIYFKSIDKSSELKFVDEKAIVATLDQKLTVTHDDLKKYIDQKFQKIDNKIDKLSEDQTSRTKKLDEKIKSEVKQKMSTLKEEKLKKLMEIKEREERKAILNKMVNEQNF
jgi:Skp family chaperone for outer membrane proteins